MRQLTIIILALLTVVSCKNSGTNENIPVSDIHKVVVDQVLQAGAYTYLQVNETGMQKWLAVPSMTATEGETYYYTGGLVMENFESKDLDRVFETVLFLEGVYTNPPLPSTAITGTGAPHSQSEQKLNFDIEVPEGGISIAELFADKKSYESKSVIIRGAVTKFNSAIMNKNWIHIQDGTDHEGKFDLTITSDQVTEPGEIITVEGKITLDKDFGAGYYYEVIIEDAKIIGN
ncbi:MAG TPA: hypothetical protein ENI20_11835 [Bacteroides sp.]|nr:hypothetical protein [Bacteroides sp.]